MREAVIVSTARTPIGKAFRGAFNDTEAPVLSGHAVREAVRRAGIEGGEVEDLVLGCATQQGSQGYNIGRLTVVTGGLPAGDPLAKASARQRSSVATLIPTSRDTKSIAELSGGNSLATIRSLYACPYRATFCYPRPQRFRSYLGGNFSDTA